MSEIYVLTPELTLAGIIEDFISIIWRPAYSDIGDFEIYLSATPKAVELLQKNYYVVRSQDVSEVDGVKTYKKVMIIKNIELTTDVEDGDFLTVSGRELKYLLHQRVVWGQSIISDTVEYAIRRLIGSNAASAVEPTRVIPNMQFADAKGYTETIELQIANKQLDEAVIELCEGYNYGWDIYITDNKLTVDIYKGVDRSYNQTERPYVVFSEGFDNLHDSSYELKSEDYANMALVGGEGEEYERIYAYVNNDVSGLERYEIFVDAKSISQNLNSDNPISQSNYVVMLEEHGKEELAKKTITEGFSGEIISDLTYVYGVDFFLGDIVTVSNKYNMTKSVRVISAIESEDEDGIKLIPQLNL